MKNIFVARHGETDFNKKGRYLGRTDEPLNTAGVIQAKELAEKIGKLDIKTIYCSPLRRALETAEFIQKKNNCRIIVDKNLIERSVGVYEGLTREKAKNKYPELYKKNITRIFDNAPPGGETVNDVIKRVSMSLNKIKKQKDSLGILIITHGFVAKAINKYFNPQISDQEFFDFSLGNAEVTTYELE